MAHRFVEVTFTATDACGNHSSTTAKYEIFDDSSNVVRYTHNNNGSIEVPYDSNCGEVTVPQIADVMATDDCGATAPWILRKMPKPTQRLRTHWAQVFWEPTVISTC